MNPVHQGNLFMMTTRFYLGQTAQGTDGPWQLEKGAGTFELINVVM